MSAPILMEPGANNANPPAVAPGDMVYVHLRGKLRKAMVSTVTMEIRPSHSACLIDVQLCQSWEGFETVRCVYRLIPVSLPVDFDGVLRIAA